MTALLGTCELCTERASKAAMIKHLAMCVPKHDRLNGKPSEIVQLRVEGKGTPMFWLDVEVKGESPLRRLDDLLRRVWLECCGHMSAFETEGLRYSVLVDHEFGRNERSMNARASEVLTSLGQRISYEYDFGSTTALTLRVIGLRAGIIGREAARVLARNEPPVWTCAACDAPAALVCPFCVDDSNPFVCARHASEHACADADEDSFLPVVNSPRMGVCGYTGDA